MSEDYNQHPDATSVPECSVREEALAGPVLSLFRLSQIESAVEV